MGITSWICAEQMVKLYNLSDQTYLLFPDDTVFHVFSEGGRLYWSLELDIPCPLEMADRVRIDTLHRDRFVPALSYETNHVEHDKVLAASFRDTVGVSYEEALGVLKLFIEEAQPPDDGFSVPFIHFEPTVNNLSRLSGYPRESIEQVLAGFSISKTNMESEGREVWKPKQEYRALRRGFFEFPHALGKHLTWSKEMARESAMLLMAGVVFKKLPPEWRSDSVNAALEMLSNQAGKWFEKIVQENLEKVNVLGFISLKDGIGQTHQRIPVPPDVGEIDYLGYAPDENLLVVLECKMVHSGLESKYFRDDISEFVTADTAYAKRFRKKFGWVRTNVPSICQALSSIRDFGSPVNPNRVAAAMITLYPTMASCSIDDFPCVTITELMLGYEANGKWPYENGVNLSP